MTPHRPLLHLLKRITTTNPLAINTHTNHPRRQPLHARVRQSRPPPPPTPFVPDAATFLTLIGRSLKQHASKFPSWSALFELTSPQLKDLGVEPARARKYLLHWREKFRRGEWGVGGDLRYVEEGVGVVGIAEVPRTAASAAPAASGGAAQAIQQDELHQQTTLQPQATLQPGGLASLTTSPNTRRVVVNLPPDTTPHPLPYVVAPTAAIPVSFLKIKGTTQIYGPHVELVEGAKGRLARIRVKEGMWEHKRGQKVDGGERRRAEVRAKKKVEANKAARAEENKAAGA